MVFCLHYDEGKIFLTFLDGYWKLPSCALEERGTLIEKTKSKIVPYKPSSTRISQEDMKNSQELFQKVLPLVYLKMLQTPNIRDVRHLPNEPVPYLRSMSSCK